MSAKKSGKKKLITDKSTDYIFEYFINEDKFNDQLKPQWDADMENKIKSRSQPKLDSRIQTDKYKDALSPSEDRELPSNSSDYSDRKSVDFTDDRSFGSETEAMRSPYGKKISPSRQYSQPQHMQHQQYQQHQQYPQHQQQPQMQQHREILPDVQKYVETAEEKRARARDELSKLQELEENYGVKLSRYYTLNDDPDEMRAEYDMWKDKRHKKNQVKLYKNILLNIVCGAEFLNDRYNPFEFKLKDWSKQVASDMDDYTEVLEEIYEKYKDRGGKMAPEIRLLFMIIMSGVTFHLSQALFGAEGLGKAVQDNPNLINKILGPLMKGGLGGLTGNSEPAEAKVPPHNKNILAAIRKHHQKSSSDVGSESQLYTTERTTDRTDASSDNRSSTNNDAIALERERRLDAERKVAVLESQMKKRDEEIFAQLEQLKNQQNNSLSQQYQQQPLHQQPLAQQPRQQQNHLTSETLLTRPPANNFNPTNQVLSGAGGKPRFLTNPLLSSIQPQSETSDNENIFTSEIKDTNKPNKIKSIVKPKKRGLDSVLDSLEDSVDIDLDSIIETSSKRKKIISISKPKKNNSITRSATKSATRSVTRGKNNGASDANTPTKKRKPTIINL